MAFQVSKTRHNSRTKHYFANPRIKSKKTWLEAYRNSYLHLIHPWAAVAVYTHRQTDTHTNTLPYTSLAHAHQGIIIMVNNINAFTRRVGNHWPWLIVVKNDRFQWHSTSKQNCVENEALFLQIYELKSKKTWLEAYMLFFYAQVNSLLFLPTNIYALLRINALDSIW